ncbi:MAG TPA: formylglycine-generating enzyme family protein [Sphingobium sp.]|uniref:formylglycine-generating enzyme family protein n=1 Tax=Sphingobium sp. TaxID=1912891 RepID=UPI002ED0D683
MRLIRGGAFRMGSEDFYPEEAPVRSVTVGDFWMDEAPVTNADFAAFVAATGYATFAERFLSAQDFPGYTPDMLVPGSSVFQPPEDAGGMAFADGVVPNWWRFVPDASWRHPFGPGSGIEGREDHPVVHVVAQDAEAYAAWTGKALPTEAEWEYAARGGLDGVPYAWGDELEPEGQRLAKYWEGKFPAENLAAPGLERTSPVRSYPANGYGLYDMIANVWEWTSDWYSDAPERDASCCGSPDRERERVRASVDPGAPVAIPRRVLKGGSHLCAVNYCRRYRPASRWPQAIDTSTSHIGFRCIVRR